MEIWFINSMRRMQQAKVTHTLAERFHRKK